MSPYTNTFLFEQIIHRFALGQMVIFILLCFEFRYFKYFFSPALKWRNWRKRFFMYEKVTFKCLNNRSSGILVSQCKPFLPMETPQLLIEFHLWPLSQIFLFHPQYLNIQEPVLQMDYLEH